MDIVLETERMILRRFTVNDVELLVELDSDAEVMLHLTGGEATPRSEIVDDVLPAFLSYYERFDEYGFWAAIERETSRFIGWFHFRPRQQDGPFEPELGYRLHRFAWGKGLATEGSRSLIDWGFREFSVERVYAETMAVHTASRRVMEKSGLRYVRTFQADWPVRIPGDEHGDVEYSITRAEWEADQAGS